MDRSDRKKAWVRIFQALGLFIALLVILPWLGGKLLPSHNDQARKDLMAAPGHGQTGAGNSGETQSDNPGGGNDTSAADTASEQGIALPMPADEAAYRAPGFSAETLETLPEDQRKLFSHQGWNEPSASGKAAGGQAGNGLSVSVKAILPLKQGGKEYQAYSINMPEGRGCLIRLLVNISGGKPDSQGRYQYVNWNFSDSNVLIDESKLKDDSLEVMHFFKAPEGQPKTYIVRVQVQDTAGTIAFADSLPITVQ